MKKEKFFDREQYLEILEKRIFGLKDGYRQNVAIIGDESVGKTSVIFKLLNRFYDNRILTLYLEARPESLAFFARRFIGVLLYNFLIRSGIPLKEDIDFLMKKAGRYIPRTVEKIRFILSCVEHRKKNNILTELFSLCELVNQESDKFCIIILDEFHNLENMGVKDLYKEWSRLLISQKNTLYIIASSLKFKAKAILAKNLSLLFGNFEVLTVEPFDIKNSKNYIEQALQGVHLDEGLKNFLAHFTGGLPFYLEVITDSLLKSNTQADLVDVLENLLFEPSGILNQRFSNYLKRFLDNPYSQDYLSILYLIASGHNKIKDIAHILHKHQKELGLRLNYLLELDTITRSGDFLKINDRVFGFWLRFVYQEKTHSLTFDAKNQKEIFRNHLDALVDEFLRDTQKPVAERIAEVMRLFKDEVIQIERKRLRLSHFREIKPMEFSGKQLKDGIIGRSNDSLWIMGFKYDALTEDDIAEFAKECRRYRHKLQRKIIIAFKDIDANANLRALEEKVWAWDINKLNQVLDVFSKSRVIV